MNVLRKKHGKHLDKRLRFRLRIYFAISVILLCVVAFEIFSGRLTFLLAIIGLALGFLIGIISARMFSLTWDRDAKKVISRLDTAGGIILALYILIAIFRQTIIGHYVGANYVIGASLSMATGVMIGRILGTGHKIVDILQQQGLF